MTNLEFEQAHVRILAAAVILRGVDLGGFLARIERSEAAGPFLDPTLYRQVGDRMARIRSMAWELQGFIRELKDPANAEAVTDILGPVLDSWVDLLDAIGAARFAAIGKGPDGPLGRPPDDAG